MNIKQAFLAIDSLRKAGITPHFIGKHGIGKSAIVYQYAASQKRKTIVKEVRVGLMADSGDLVGIQEFIKCKTTGQPLSTRHVLPDWFMEAVAAVEEAAESDYDVIIFIDEMNRGHKDLLQAIFELVYDLSLKGVKLRKGCFVIAASNPPTDDYAVLDFSDSAFQDRFCHIKLEPTKDEFLTYIRNKAPTSSVADFIQEYDRMLESSDLKTFDLSFVKPSRRSWDRITTLEAVKAPEEIELELFMGIVGFEAASAYRTFRETNFKAIKATDVLNNYSKAKKDVLNAIKKGRNDMLGTLNEELDQLIKSLQGLTEAQADNLAELAHDLTPEHAYALGIIIKGNQHVAKEVEVLDPSKYISGHENMGMFAHKKFVERISAIKLKRDEMTGTATT